ncbi:MAG: hypothetical protein ACT4PU_10185 [Planctomycetota bacterium]
MKSIIVTPIVLALSLGSAAAAQDLTASERTALQGLPVSNLAELRAGAAADVPAVRGLERVELLRATAAATDLAELRAGEASTRDLSVTAVVIGVIILAIIIF